MSQIAALVVAMAAIAASVAGLIVVRRRFETSVFRGDHDVAGAILGVIGTLYAVLVAFTVVIVWTHFTDARAAADMEADKLGDLARLAGGLEAGRSQRVQALLRGYGTAVIQDEWPAMAQRRSSPVAAEALARLWSEYESMAPEGNREVAIYGQSIEQLGAMTDLRRQRLRSIEHDVPPLMWMVLIAGGAIVVCFTYLFAPERRTAHALMVAAVAAMVVLTLFLAYDLDNPFDGWPTVSPTVMHEQLERLRQQRPS